MSAIKSRKAANITAVDSVENYSKSSVRVKEATGSGVNFASLLVVHRLRPPLVSSDSVPKYARTAEDCGSSTAFRPQRSGLTADSKFSTRCDDLLTSGVDNADGAGL